MDQSHVLNLMFALDDSTVPVTAAGSYIDEYTDLDEGACSVVNDENCVLSAASVLTDDRVKQTGVRIVGRLNNELYYSDMIKAEDLISYRGIAYSAAAEQITYIGYTGAAGSIRVINDNLYKMKIMFQQIGRTGQNRQETIDVCYKSDATATATEITFGLLEGLLGSLNAQPEDVITVGVRNSAAVTAANALDHNATVVQGSKFVTITTNLEYNGGGASVVVGDLLRIGTVAGATALTSNVYYVEELVSTTVVRLDRPVTDASGTYATGTDDIEVIPIASIANYGFVLTGVAQPWVLGKRQWSKISFTIGLEDFGETELSYNTASSLGMGTENQIRDLEYFCKGQTGYKYRGDYAYTGYTSAVSVGDTFNQLCITWASDSRSESIGGPGHNPKQLIIAIETAYDNNDANDILIDVLDAYFDITSGIGV